MEHRPPWFTEAWLAALGSRQVVARLAATDGHLDCAADWDTGERALEEWLLYRIDRGAIIVHGCGMRLRAEAGSLVLIPAGCVFRSHSADGPCRLSRCRLDLGAGFDTGCDAMLCGPCLRGPTISDLIDLAARADAPLHGVRVAALLLSTLAPMLDRAAAEGFSGEQRQQIEHWCRDHIRHRPEAGDIARVLGLSLDYCSRLFRRSYGCPPRAWLLRERLRQVAVALRESDCPLDEIARSFGYADQNLMGRQFKQAYGCSPGRFRSGVAS